jgi:WD40 repeat protein
MKDEANTMDFFMDIAYVISDHKRTVTDSVWSPDGNQLASGSFDTTIRRRWNIATEEPSRCPICGKLMFLVCTVASTLAQN